jgi:hypothetical protein
MVQYIGRPHVNEMKALKNQKMLSRNHSDTDSDEGERPRKKSIKKEKKKKENTKASEDECANRNNYFKEDNEAKEKLEEESQPTEKSKNKKIKEEKHEKFEDFSKGDDMPGYMGNDEHDRTNEMLLNQSRLSEASNNS